MIDIPATPPLSCSYAAIFFRVPKKRYLMAAASINPIVAKVRIVPVIMTQPAQFIILPISMPISSTLIRSTKAFSGLN
jgi:hypothetical protein